MAIFAGVDVSKAHLDVAVRPSGEQWRANNNDEGVAETVKRIAAFRPQLVVLEATGGLQAPLVAALAVAKVPVAVVNPRQVRDFARATGKLAKTDKLDAVVLAHFAEAIKPEPRPLPDEKEEQLRALIVRRREMVDMLVAEKNRATACRSKSLRAEILVHVDWLTQRVRDLDKNLDEAIKQSSIWRENEELLRSVPGVGRIVAVTLLTQLPELGRLDQKKIAALAGVAPLNHDSGTMRGTRRIWGGRAEVRKVLYMAAVTAKQHNPTIKRVYERLCSVGKARKLALVACMRKLLTILNAMMKSRKLWTAELGLAR